MPRATRKKSGTGIYHVMLRGINRQDIFEEREDYVRMLTYLQHLLERYDEKGKRLPPLCTVYAYCLMSNHVHLLLRVHDEDISKTIKSLAVKYAVYFNQKYSRSGHLFQDRFKSEPVDDETYFLTLMRYIHQNPLMAGMVKHVREYEWSSWGEYLGDIPLALSVCDTKAVLERIPLSDLKDLVETPLDGDVRCLDVQDPSLARMGDKELRQFLRERHAIDEPLKVQSIEKAQRNDIILSCLDKGAGLRQLSRITGVTYGVIYRLQGRTDQGTVLIPIPEKQRP